MNILVTGVAGAIGSFLLDSLIAKGHRVIGIDNLSYGKIKDINHHLNNKMFNFINADVNHFDFNTLGEVDCICHLAALKKISNVSNWKRTELIKNNLATSRLLEFSATRKSKFVFSSTSDVYGTSDDLPFKENGNLEIGPSDIKRWDYAASKLFDEHACFSYSEDYGFPVVVMRYFGAYSHRSKWEYGEHIPLFMKLAMEYNSITIHGDGLHTRSMCHINDAVDCTVKIIESDSVNWEIINVGSNEEMTILDHAKIIWDAVNGDEPKIQFVPIEKVFGKYKEIQRRVPDLSKAKRLLGYEPKISFKEGVRMVLNQKKYD